MMMPANGTVLCFVSSPFAEKGISDKGMTDGKI